jgi:hypothetical protein
MNRTLTVLSCFMGLASSLLWADEARIPIFTPTTISQSGYYILTRDISVSSGPAITIAPVTPPIAVTLDLNGHSLQSTSLADSVIDAGGVDSLTIVAGQVRGGRQGMGSGPVGHLKVERIEVSGSQENGISFSTTGIVDIVDCHVHDVGTFGIFLNTTSATRPTFAGHIAGNKIERTGAVGIFLEGLRSGNVQGNLIIDWGSSGTFPGLVIQPGAGPGCGGNLLAENTVTSTLSTGGEGIFVACPGNIVRENVVKGGHASGVHLFSDENLIEWNLISGIVGHGIEVGSLIQPKLVSRNHVESNLADGNSGCGINFVNGNGHSYRNNIVRGNTTAGVCGGALDTNVDGGGNIL